MRKKKERIEQGGEMSRRDVKKKRGKGEVNLVGWFLFSPGHEKILFMSLA